MVSKGELSQDVNGRVRIDELVALLKVRSTHVKRGHKIKVDITNYNKKIYKFNGVSLEIDQLELDNLTLQNESVDYDIVKKAISQLCHLSSATLEEIANQVMFICHHKRRLAKIGLSTDGEQVLKIMSSNCFFKTTRRQPD